MTRHTPSPARERSVLRAVALPSEHGGWGLSIEPGLLGLLVVPSWAGGCLAIAAVLAFLARTPLKLALVDRRRGRQLERTRLATRVGSIELVGIVALGAVAAWSAGDVRWALPLVLAGPLFALELWYDVRSRGRRLVPELAGAVAVASVAAAVATAGGEPWRVAAGLWAVLAARSLTSIPHVRRLIMQLHGRPTSAADTLAGDIVAMAVACGAVFLDPAFTVGAVGVAAIVAGQRAMARHPVTEAKVVGIRQMVLGFALVLATAAGFHLT